MLLMKNTIYLGRPISAFNFMRNQLAAWSFHLFFSLSKPTYVPQIGTSEMLQFLRLVP
jgi:hypothetical protein